MTRTRPVSLAVALALRVSVGKSNFSDVELALHTRMLFKLIESLDELDAAGEPVLCKQDPDLWFPEGQGAAVYASLKEAKAACMPCPLRDQCLTFALVADKNEGVWGGTTPIERKNIRKDLVRHGQINRVAEHGYLAYRRQRLQTS